MTVSRPRPAIPADLESCFRKPAPSVPDRDLSGREIYSIALRQRRIDAEKTDCGERAIRWMKRVTE